MSKVIYCHKKKAQKPYEISRIHRKIYTIEELCYYLRNNLYLADETLINHALCTWLKEELELDEMADKIKQVLNNDGTTKQLVLMILIQGGIYEPTELTEISGILETYKNQTDVEREKYKADTLLTNGEMEAAILIYLEILMREKDDTMDASFYGYIYANLGSAYGKLFLYEEAMLAYGDAIAHCKEPVILEAYIYSAWHTLSSEDYFDFLLEDERYKEIDCEIQERIKLTKAEDKGSAEELLEHFKADYRRSYI